MMISDLDNKSNSSSGSSHTHEQLYGMSTPSNVEIVNSKSGIETILPFKKTLNPKIHDCPYPDCNKSFHCKSRLSDHINSHTGERPYTCCFVGCTRTFTSSASLYQHHKLKHGMMTMPSIAAPHLSHHVLERKENRRRSSSMFSGVVGVGVGGGGGGGASMNLCDLCKRSCNMLQQSPHHHGISTPPISASDAANGSSSTSSSSKTTTLVLLPPPSAAAHLYLPAATKIIPSSASATASASAAASLAPHLSAASHHFSAPVSSSHHHIHRHPQQHRQHSSFMRVDALPPYYQHPHQYDMSMSYAAAAGTPYSHCDSSSNYASPMSHCSTTSSSSTSSSEANSTTTTTTTPTTTTSSVTPTTSAMATAAGSNMIIRSSQPSSSPSFVQINRDYICPYIECSKRFNQKTNLVNHIRTHTGERPYMCALETCKKSFTQLAALNSHQLTHMTGRSFTCPTCKKAFKNANYLDKHMLIHSLSIQNNNAEHRIMNESKSSSSDENNNDSAHKSAETDKQDSFVCLMCPNLVFERSEHLAEHLANHKS